MKICRDFLTKALRLVPFLTLAACGGERGIPEASSTLVTDVQHSAVKRQAIGNCWLYAAASWIESLSLKAGDPEMDISESYWTWWYFYEQILADSAISEVDTGGSWRRARDLILRHGFILEDQFLPAETGLEMSQAQAQATLSINQQLKVGGALADPLSRTPERVERELDRAFGSTMRLARSKARMPDGLTIGRSVDGERITLARALVGNPLQAWREVSFPRLYGEAEIPSPQVLAARHKLLSRVFRALNAREPVVMSVMIDFNGLDITDATFKGQLLKRNRLGKQGAHMLPLEDYTVQNVPGWGTVGRGDLSPQVKEAAVSGDLDRLVAKNSWGTKRPERGLTDGYTGFDAAYLMSQFPWKNDENSPAAGISWYTSLTSFILPPGY